MRKIFLLIPRTLEYLRSTVVVGWAADNVMFNTCRTTGTNNRSRQFLVFIYPPVRCFENRTWPENVCNVLFTLFCVWNTSSQVFFVLFCRGAVWSRCERREAGWKHGWRVTSQRFYNNFLFAHQPGNCRLSPEMNTWTLAATANNLLLQGHLGKRDAAGPAHRF